jgi:hypothetical protein
LIPLFAKVGRIEIYYEASSLAKTWQFCGSKDEWNINYGSKIIYIENIYIYWEYIGRNET